MVYFKFEFGFGRSSKGNESASQQKEVSGWEFVNAEVEKARTEGKFKTASNYLTAARAWTRFITIDEWHFSEMSAKRVEQCQRWLAEQGICMNTISAYMRALRVLYHRAMKNMGSNIVQVTKDDDGNEPFDKVFTGRAKTTKRSLSKIEIQRLHALSLAPDTSIALARDLFLFSFYAMGMPFVDVAYLKKCQMKDGVIRYARHKTGQQINVAIETPMLKIIQRYETPSSEYVFPILTEQAPEALHKQYQRSLRRYNYSLKRLSKMIGSSHPLSSYVVRHTWASMAYQHNIDIGLIGKALGHTKSSTTLLYIRSLFDPNLASANQSLMQELGF